MLSSKNVWSDVFKSLYLTNCIPHLFILSLLCLSVIFILEWSMYSVRFQPFLSEEASMKAQVLVGFLFRLGIPWSIGSTTSLVARDLIKSPIRLWVKKYKGGPETWGALAKWELRVHGLGQFLSAQGSIVD